jgi:hypothetical protein
MVPRIPNPLFDYLIQKYDLKNDRALGEWLSLDQPTISKMRLKKPVITADVILRVHELTEMPVSEIKRIIRGEK